MLLYFLRPQISKKHFVKLLRIIAENDMFFTIEKLEMDNAFSSEN